MNETSSEISRENSACEDAALPEAVIVIPTKNRKEKLEKCIYSIRAYTDYPRYHIVLVDNGSDDPEALALLGSLSGEDLTLLRAPIPFDFSKRNNLGVAAHPAPVVACLNDDLEIPETQGSWLRELAETVLAHDGNCVVSPLLCYPDGRIQCAGMETTFYPFCGLLVPRLRLHNAQSETTPEAHEKRELSALVGACMVTSYGLWQKLGGMDEAFPVILNDVDFCFRARKAGAAVLFLGTTQLLHHEGVSAHFHFFAPRYYFWLYRFSIRHFDLRTSVEPHGEGF